MYLINKFFRMSKSIQQLKKEPKNIRCLKCKRFGHSNTDKSCPLYGKSSSNPFAIFITDFSIFPNHHYNHAATTGFNNNFVLAFTVNNLHFSFIAHSFGDTKDNFVAVVCFHQGWSKTESNLIAPGRESEVLTSARRRRSL